MVIVNQCPLKKPFLQTKALSRKSSKTWMPQEPHQKLGIRILWWQIPPNLRNLLTPDKNNIFLNSYTSGLDTSKLQIYQPILVPLRFKKILSKITLKPRKNGENCKNNMKSTNIKKIFVYQLTIPTLTLLGALGANLIQTGTISTEASCSGWWNIMNQGWWFLPCFVSSSNSFSFSLKTFEFS